MNFTMSLAKEMAPYNVNVNAINPGLLWTNLWEKGHGVIIGAETDRPPRRVFDEFVQAAVPLGREQTPDDVGHMAVYLASDESKKRHGAGPAPRRRGLDGLSRSNEKKPGVMSPGFLQGGM